MSTLNDYVINVGSTWDDLTPRATSDSKEEAIKIAKLYRDRCLEVVYSPCNDPDTDDVVWRNTDGPESYRRVLTQDEKYRILLCVKYARHELSTNLLKTEIEYQGYTHYDAKLEQEMSQTRDSIACYDNLIDKLEKIL